MQLGLADLHGALENVDLELTDLDDRRERHRVPVRPSQDRDHAGQQLFGRKGDGQNIVHPSFEGSELGPQITSPRQADDGQPHASGRSVGEQGDDFLPVEVHVEDDEVRLPHGNVGCDLARRSHGAGGVDTVVERQLDQFGKRWPVEHQQHPRRPARRLGPIAMGG